MTKFFIGSALAASALIAATAGVATAQTVASRTTMAAKSTRTMKPAATKKVVIATRTRAAATAPKGRMVTTKTSTGKTITYNCSLPGNAAKTACKHG